MRLQAARVAAAAAIAAAAAAEMSQEFLGQTLFFVQCS
jgi:hypothetical protein